MTGAEIIPFPERVDDTEHWADRFRGLILRRRDLKPAVRLLWMTISDDSADEGHPGWMDYPSVGELGRRVAMSGRTAARAISTLVDARVLRVDGVRYELMLSKPMKLARKAGRRNGRAR